MTAFRPLLKWPGGKKREWAEIEPFLPDDVRDFIDPFMGGCAPFGLARFSGHGYLSDRHQRLVDLHARVQGGDADLFRELAAIGERWDGLHAESLLRRREFARLVRSARDGEPVRSGGDPVTASIEDKARRVAKLEERHRVHFDDAALAEHCETAIRAAFYTAIRTEERTATDARATACFLFVRDYCYGSMFRSNAKGEFNIPYGGTSYNSKSFLSRLEQLRSPRTRQRFARATFYSLDFEEFLTARASSMTARDLVFVDPPYDSDFSTYGGNAFGIADQERLAAALARLSCRFIVVIKETKEIRRIYPGDLVRGSFGKQYGYNVRGRNDRSARHLVIANYAPSS